MKLPYETDVLIDRVEEKENLDVVKATIIVQKKYSKRDDNRKGSNCLLKE